MADEQNTIQVESSADSLGEAPVKSVPVTDEKPTAGKPDGRQASDSERDHGDEAGDEGSSQRAQEPGKENTPDWLQKKLDKVTAKRRTAEQERDYWRAEALKAKESVTDKPKSEPDSASKADKAPTLEEFDYDQDAYVQAMIKHGIKQEREREKVETEKQRVARESQERMTKWTGRATAFAEDHPDFQEVAHNPNLPVSEVMAESIQDSEIGPEILYWLGKNPEEALRIYQMKPHAAGAAIARIEAKLGNSTETVERETEAEQPERKITKAPPPIKTLNPSAPVKKDLADMSMADYVAERNRTRRKPNGFL